MATTTSQYTLKDALRDYALTPAVPSETSGSIAAQLQPTQPGSLVSGGGTTTGTTQAQSSQPAPTFYESATANANNAPSNALPYASPSAAIESVNNHIGQANVLSSIAARTTGASGLSGAATPRG